MSVPEIIGGAGLVIVGSIVGFVTWALRKVRGRPQPPSPPGWLGDL